MISDCRERPSASPPPPLRQGAPLPPGLHVTLEFNADIDWDVAAAGDAISATLRWTVTAVLTVLVLGLTAVLWINRAA